jgi:hypothetical protein
VELLRNERAQILPAAPVTDATTVNEDDSRPLAFLDVGQFDIVHLEFLHLHLLGGAMQSGLSGKEDGAQQRKRK